MLASLERVFKVGTAVLALGFTLGLSGCESDTENAVEDVGEAVEDAGDKVKDALD